MNAANDFTRLVDNLAGDWTEPVLRILKSTGIRVSVDMEVDAWRTLKHVLRSEFRWQRYFRFSTLVSLGTLMEQALRKAALYVAQKFEPQAVTYELKSRISQLAGERRSTATERGLYSAIVRRPALRAAFRAPTRTDFVPRLHVSGAAMSGGACAVI
jgi:hypothetical protein